MWCFHLRFTDVIDVVQAIKTHPVSEVAKCLKIGAVTCCVDPLNCFLQNRLVQCTITSSQLAERQTKSLSTVLAPARDVVTSFQGYSPTRLWTSRIEPCERGKDVIEGRLLVGVEGLILLHISG